MTPLLLAVLLAVPSAAQAVPDACRTGRALENRPVRLSILPTNGSAPIELLLSFAGCRTETVEPLLLTDTPPTAVRAYLADGIAWQVYFSTEDGGGSTEAYIFYTPPGSRLRYPVAHLKQRPTAAVASGRVDWGTVRFLSFDAPQFDFSAQVVTQ